MKCPHCDLDLNISDVCYHEYGKFIVYYDARLPIETWIFEKRKILVMRVSGVELMSEKRLDMLLLLR